MAFKPGQNPNHPKRGASIKVDPIRDLNHIEAIKTMLIKKGQLRNYCLFTLGINTAWRANELLSVRIGQVKNLQIGEVLELKQSKNNRYRATLINGASYQAILLWLAHHKSSQDDMAPLFPSVRGGLLGVPVLCNLVKGWCRSVGANGRFGSHSLRKSWGYHQRVQFGEPLTLISQAFGHSSERQTLNYIGIQPDEVASLFRHEL